MKVQFVKVFNRAVASVELTRLSFVCIQKIGFGIRFTTREDFGESRTHALGFAVRCLNQLGYEIIVGRARIGLASTP